MILSHNRRRNKRRYGCTILFRCAVIRFRMRDRRGNQFRMPLRRVLFNCLTSSLYLSLLSSFASSLRKRDHHDDYMHTHTIHYSSLHHHEEGCTRFFPSKLTSSSISQKDDRQQPSFSHSVTAAKHETGARDRDRKNNQFISPLTFSCKSSSSMSFRLSHAAISFRDQQRQS